MANHGECSFITNNKTVSCIDIDSSGFDWCFRYGVTPYVGVFVISNDATVEIRQEMKLVINGTSVDRLFCIKPVEYLSPEYKQITIADVRYLWSRVKVSEFFNLRHRTGILSYFNNFNDVGYAKEKLRYFSLVDSKGLEHVDSTKYVGGMTQPTDGKAWTAFEIIRFIFKKYLNEDIIIHGKFKDNKYVPENQEFIAMPLPQVIETLLPMANAGLWIDCEGKIRISDLYADNSKWKVNLGTLSGSVQFTGEFLKPDSMRVIFQKVKEKTARYTTGTDITGAIPLRMVTVAPVDLIINSQLYQRGEYVDLIELVNALLGRDSSSPLTAEFKKFLRYFPKPSGLERLFLDELTLTGVLGTTATENVKTTILSNIRNDFLQNYQIPKSEMDKIISLKAEYGDIKNPIINLKLMSPVYADWYELRKALYVGNKQEKKNINFVLMHQSKYNKSNFKKSDIPPSGTQHTITESKQFGNCPANLTIKDPDLGILRVDFGYDQTQSVLTRQFGILANYKTGKRSFPAYLLLNKTPLWQDFGLENVFSFETIISIVDGTDPVYIYPPENEEPEKLKYKNSKNTAKQSDYIKKNNLNTIYVFSNKLIATIPDEYNYRYSDGFLGEPRNIDVLREIVRLEKEQLEYMWDDHTQGVIKTQTKPLKTKDINLQGRLKSVIIHAGHKSNFILWDFSFKPVPKNQWADMNPKLRSFVYKSLTSWNGE